MCRISNCFFFVFCKDGNDWLMKQAFYSCIFVCVVLAAAYLRYRRYRLSCLPFIWHFFSLWHTHTRTHTCTHTHKSEALWARIPEIQVRIPSRAMGTFSLIPSALSFVFLWHTHARTHAHARAHTHTHTHNPLQLDIHCTSIALLRGLLSEWEKKRFELFGRVEAWNFPGTEQTVDHFQERWRDELMVFHQKKNLITINGCYLHSLQWSRWRGAKVKGKRKMATRTEDWWHRSKEKIWLQMGDCKDKGYIPMHVCLAHTCRVWEEVTISAKNLLNTKTKHKVTDFRSCMNCFKPYERETLGDITISWCMWATTCTAVCLPTPLRPARRIEPPGWVSKRSTRETWSSTSWKRNTSNWRYSLAAIHNRGKEDKQKK